MTAISIALPPTPQTPALAAHAEHLGYDRVWLYDTPALQLDVWMHLALCARETNRIGLGPAVLIPSLRHPLVTAATIATLESLAGGRTAYAIGSGFTGRRALGQKPMRWADVVTYVRRVQGLLRGDDVEVDGAIVAMIHGEGQAPARPIDVPWLIGAGGPKGFAAARELGAGVFTTVPAPGFEHSALLSFGTVLDDGEDVESPRVSRPRARAQRSPTTRCTSSTAPRSTRCPARRRGWPRSRPSRRRGATSRCTAAT